MERESKWPDLLQLNFVTITIIVALTLAGVVVIGEYLDKVATAKSFILEKPADSTYKADYEIFKLRAEVQQIRSDTAGRAFWIKLVGIFITVTGAIAGFLIGQSKAAKDRLKAEEKRDLDQLAFQHRKDVDDAYQQAAPGKGGELLSDVSGMDLLHANAADAYWAKADFRGQTSIVQICKRRLSAAQFWRMPNSGKPTSDRRYLKRLIAAGLIFFWLI